MMEGRSWRMRSSGDRCGRGGGGGRIWRLGSRLCMKRKMVVITLVVWRG